MTGYWIDTATDELVNEPPERGVQVVAPGTEPTDWARSVIDAYNARKAPKKTAAKKKAARKTVETATEPTGDIETAEG